MRGKAGEGLANIISIHDIHDHLSNQIAASLELVNFIHDLMVHTCGCVNVHQHVCGCRHSPEFKCTVQLSTDFSLFTDPTNNLVMVGVEG